MRGGGILCYLAIIALFCMPSSFPALGQESLTDCPSRSLAGPGTTAANDPAQNHPEFPSDWSSSRGNLTPFVSAAAIVPSQDFGQVVLPITSVRLTVIGVEAAFGTGFCLDLHCRFIATNYHIAMTAQPQRINGEKIRERYLDTGPTDEGATLNDGPDTIPLAFNLSRDLAIFELQHPLSKYRGATLSLEDLQIGEQVDIYSFPKESSNPVRHLQAFHGSFEGQTPEGLLGFRYNVSAGHAIRPGASGGIVVNSRTQEIVGVLSEIAIDGQPIVLALPVEALAEFVSRVQPSLASQLFSRPIGRTSFSSDLYPRYEPPIANDCQHRPEESYEVKILRNHAQLLADSMRNFIAVETFSWGSGDKQPSAQSAYEVRVLDGYQRFREYPNGTRELEDVPFPRLNTAVVPGGEWSQLPEMVGTELRLEIHRASDAVINDRPVKVFQYRARPEDNICRWKSSADFGLFAVSKIVSVACYGEVWSDEEGNILRISERYDLPGKWKDYQSIVTYGWIRRSDNSARLIPLTISTQAEHNSKLYWCRGRFTNYKVFSSQTKITSN